MAKNSPDEGKSTKMVEKQVDPSFNNLKEYRAKRQFSETPEPMADTVETQSGALYRNSLVFAGRIQAPGKGSKHKRTGAEDSGLVMGVGLG